MSENMKRSIFINPSIQESRSYRITREVFNALTHGIGFILAIIGTVFLIQKGVYFNSVQHTVAYAIFGLSMCLMFYHSMLYHSLYFTKVKPIFQYLDHASIYLLIAGSYTPFALLVVGGWQGVVLLALEWGLALIGLILESFNLTWLKKYSTFVYLLMGWLGIFLIPSLLSHYDLKGLVWLLIGGLAYSLGTIFYKFDNKGLYFHVIWHFFVLLGALGIFLAIYLYV